MKQTTTLKSTAIIIAHIVTWSCFFMLPWFFIPRQSDLPNFGSPFFKILMGINIFLVIFFYLNSYVLIPKILWTKKWILYFLIILIIFIVFINLPKFFIEIFDIKFHEGPINFKRPPTGRRPFGRIPIFSSSALFFLVFTISTSIKLIQQWLQNEKQKKEYENEMLKSELSFLKTQINPHFFFNTLNNIYSLAVSKNEKTAPTILKLSTIMRYVLSESKQEMVLLSEEINFIKDYLELQKVRLTNKVEVELIILGEVDKQKIPQLLFIPFIENAFKYGVSTVENSKIIISIDAKENEVIFKAANTIVSQTNEQLVGKNGIGIKNSKRRLELLYKDAFDLNITNENKIFTVTLHLYNYDN